MIENYDSVDVFVGVDVGKGEHHAVALNRAGKVIFDKALPNDEGKMRAVLQKLKQHGIVLVVVDQPATIGALPIAVAQAESVLVGYLPGLAMRRIADLHAGEAKTDARDAAIIAQAARTLPHALRSIQLADESVAELSMLCGFDDDILGQMTATSNRIRGLLTQIHPALERVIGPHLDHPAMLDLLQHYPSPAAMKTAGTTRMATRLLKLAPRMGRRLAEEITQALSEQTVVVVGTNAAATVLPRLAEQLAALRRQRTEIAVVVEKLVEAHPLSPVLTSMPASRDQDRSQAPHRSRRKTLRDRRPPRLLRRTRPGDPQIRLLNQGRTSVPAGKQDPQTGSLSIRFRGFARPRLQELLRPQNQPGQTPQPSPHRVSPTTL